MQDPFQELKVAGRGEDAGRQAGSVQVFPAVQDLGTETTRQDPPDVPPGQALVRQFIR
jgi:hypothetical protein